ncbi:MAG: hypothetical protein ACXW09_15840, partial [Methylococcaceae bacterium]
MKPEQTYLNESTDNPVMAITQAIDRDVERGEDILMLGLGTVMLSSTLAPVLPPQILLPLVALTFAISAGFARRNYHAMQRKLSISMKQLSRRDRAALHPIA